MFTLSNISTFFICPTLFCNLHFNSKPINVLSVLLIKILVLWLAIPLKSEVVGVMDGDTIELKIISPIKTKRGGKNLRVRLNHINCPERGQAFFTKAKNFTAAACYRKVVKIVHHNQYDRYGRLLGEVVLPDGSNLNQSLVRNGLAIHYKKYSSSGIYANIEIEARIKKIGLWANQ
jgi:micrococcal nuclease